MSVTDLPRVLCFSPYTYWELHGQWEVSFLHGARARGADVTYVLCDGVMSECDLFWAATLPRYPLSCLDCQGRVAGLMSGLRMPYRWLGRWTMPEDRAAAESWVASLGPSDLLSAVHGDWALGAWVLSSVNTHFRTAPPQLEVPEVEATYRRYLASVFQVAMAFERLLDDVRPEVLLLFNGRQAPTRIAFELANRRGIRIICHERGGRSESLRLFENVRCDSHAMMRQLREVWEEVPLDGVELRTIEMYMRGRAEGRGLGWRAFSKGSEDPVALRHRLGLDERPVWVVFTSSDDESAASEDYRSVFQSHGEWLMRTVDWIAGQGNVQCVIRVHPNTGGRAATGSNRRQMEEIARLAASAPSGLCFVMPEDKTSSYALLEVADQVLVYHSTIGLEAGVRGLPVLVCGRPEWWGASFADHVSDAAGYEARLEHLSRLGPTLSSKEIRRRALRLAYAYFFRYMLGFAPVRMPDPHTGRLAWNSPEALGPGQDPGLDRIVSILLDGKPVVPAPSAVERSRTSETEDLWLEEGRLRLEKPTVSIILTCCRGEGRVAAAMESVLAQTFQDFELLVVGDASSFHGLAEAKEVASRYPHHPIRVWHESVSGALATIRNVAISEARAPYIACLAADELLEPHFLAACVALLNRMPEVGLVYVDTQDLEAPQRRLPGGSWQIETLRTCYSPPRGYLFRQEAWARVGGFRTNVSGFEDWDFWLALSMAGLTGERIAYPWFRSRGSTEVRRPSFSVGDFQSVASVRKNNARLFSMAELREAEWWQALSALKDGREPGRLPPLSVILSHEGDEPGLELRLAELIGSLPEDSFELIILQRGASLGLEALLPDLEGDLVVLQEPAGGPGGAALNRAASVARGKYLLWIGADVVWDLVWMTPLFEALSADSEVQAVSSDGPVWLQRDRFFEMGGCPDGLSWPDVEDWLVRTASRFAGQPA